MNKLFIYIPTYNRPKALKAQLSALLPQVESFPQQVRILVNDNSSDDPLENVFDKYLSSSNIQFRQNVGNIGGNANIALGFIYAQPDEFLWILSDNDIVTSQAVAYILNLLNKEIDFYCFNYSIEEPTEIEHLWADGCQSPMDWRLGLISDGLYNVNSIKGSIDAAFYYHNSSFPHLAVAFSAMKMKGSARFGLLPRAKINNAMFSSAESPTDYTLANVCMPFLTTLFPLKEAESFSILWLRNHGVDFYLQRKCRYHLYLQSKAILAYYGGWRAKFLLMLVAPVCSVAIPIRIIRKCLLAFIKKYFSASIVNLLKKYRYIIWGK